MSAQIIQGDVLCVGGGIAGMMAAIRASELGAKVVVADKANTIRSGSAATGNDHFRCYIPDFHGPDIEPVIEEAKAGQAAWRPEKFIRTWLERSFEMVKLWDSWGIPMKYNGRWEFAGHTFPGRIFPHLKYSGQNQKHILTNEARKRGANIVNRVMIFDLLRDKGNIIGAVGVHTREDKIIIFLAKAVVLGTGLPVRLYPSITPGWMFNRADSPHTTGDGRAMAYRAGAELVNMEKPMRWAGPKYFARCGKGTWVGVLRDPQDNPVGPFVTKPDRLYGDPISDSYKGLFEAYWKSGKGPVFMDCRGIQDDDYEYMVHWMYHEGNSALMDYLRKEDVDPRKHPIEFMTYEMTTMGGVYYDEKARTSLEGLYAAGDEYFGGISMAATFGWIAGENAAGYARAKEAADPGVIRETVEEKRKLIEMFRNRESGASWQEVSIASQQTMQDYAGTIRSDSLLESGREHLERIKKRAYKELMGKNQHELMHCLEAMNLIEIGEMVFLGILERKETRERFARMDYPYRNPLLDDKILVYRKGDNGRPILEWRKTKKLKEDRNATSHR